MHMSDIHLDSTYKEGASVFCVNDPKYALFKSSGCCRNDPWVISLPPNQKARKLGEINCESTYSLVIGTLEWIRDNLPDLEFIIFTGDMSSHNGAALTGKRTMAEINFVFDSFKLYLPNVKLYHSIGNHDIYMQEQFASIYPLNFYTKIFMQNYLEKWKGDIGDFDETTQKTILSGGYYATHLFDGKVLLLNFNSSIYDPRNYILGDIKDDSFKQFLWLENQLIYATQNKINVWIIQHEPPCNKNKTFQKMYIRLLAKYKSTIQYIFAGHEHQNNFYFLYLGDEYINTVLVNSSIVQVKHESTFRVYELDENIQLTNYIQYKLDLEESYKNEKITYHEYFHWKNSLLDGPLNETNFLKLRNDLITDDTKMYLYMYLRNYKYECQKNYFECMKKRREELHCRADKSDKIIYNGEVIVSK